MASRCHLCQAGPAAEQAPRRRAMASSPGLTAGGEEAAVAASALPPHLVHLRRLEVARLKPPTVRRVASMQTVETAENFTCSSSL